MYQKWHEIPTAGQTGPHRTSDELLGGASAGEGPLGSGPTPRAPVDADARGPHRSGGGTRGDERGSRGATGEQGGTTDEVDWSSGRPRSRTGKEARNPAGMDGLYGDKVQQACLTADAIRKKPASGNK
ncbi:hypothetical protein BDN70DRAFT_971817 [Pholiota conissans]|uniref:Uncharacterized protein n=1 Tax=Pholiota conissans TaxID=109636 RepID=A0A9P5Z6K9_9AGAR|nr:hypothetical protein BDN70DRAFT_971817 [Pholiota conissans]